MGGGEGIPSQISLLPAKFGKEDGLNVIGIGRASGCRLPTGMSFLTQQRTRRKACVFQGVFAFPKCNTTAFGWEWGKERLQIRTAAYGQQGVQIPVGTFSKCAGGGMHLLRNGQSKWKIG